MSYSMLYQSPVGNLEIITDGSSDAIRIFISIHTFTFSYKS